MKPFNSIARLLILLLFASQFSANYAEKKIFVVSDIHVMDSSLLDSPDNAAWQEDLAKNKKMQGNYHIIQARGEGLMPSAAHVCPVTIKKPLSLSLLAEVASFLYIKR